MLIKIKENKILKEENKKPDFPEASKQVFKDWLWDRGILFEKLYFNPDPDKLNIGSNIYYYLYTNDHSTEYSFFSFPPETRQKIDKKYREMLENTTKYAESIGWRCDTPDYDGSWCQWTKPALARLDEIPHTFKVYVSLEKKDPESYINELSKIKDLIKVLDSKKLNNRFSFKVATFFNDSYPHLDNIVIHFKNKKDSSMIEEAVKESGIKTVDRTQYGRPTLGVDPVYQDRNGKEKKTSDSDYVAEQVAPALLGKQINEIKKILFRKDVLSKKGWPEQLSKEESRKVFQFFNVKFKEKFGSYPDSSAVSKWLQSIICDESKVDEAFDLIFKVCMDAMINSDHRKI